MFIIFVSEVGSRICCFFLLLDFWFGQSTKLENSQFSCLTFRIEKFCVAFTADKLAGGNLACAFNVSWPKQSSSSHFGFGVIPVDGVGRISYGHCLFHASPFRSITCIVAYSFTTPFFFIFYLFFPRLFRFSSSSTTSQFKFQSLHYHILIFPQNMIVPPHTTCFSLPIQKLLNTQQVRHCFFDLTALNHTSIARIVALSFLLKIAIFFSLMHHVSLPYNIADLTQRL